MQLYTCQLGQWRAAKAAGAELLDITVRSGNRAFAPEWDMVMGHKDGTLSDRDYAGQYGEMMRRSLETNAGEWDRLLNSEAPVAIACYCRAGKFCHRHLLKILIERQCARRGIPFAYLGELVPENRRQG